MRPDDNSWEFSILTCLWKEKGAATSPYCISVWIWKGNFASRWTLPYIKAHSLKTGVWAGFQTLLTVPLLTVSVNCPCAGHNWHLGHYTKALKEQIPAPWNNFSFNRKRSFLFSILFKKKKKGGGGEGETNTEMHYNEKTISENS